MRSYWLPTLLVMVLICRDAVANDNTDRQDWKKETIDYLKKISPTNTTRLADIRILGGGKILRYEVVDEGLIRIGTNGWVYLKMHSADDENTSVGDIVLAIDLDGHLYQNDGHVCSGIILKSQTGREFQSIHEFLSTLVLKKKWRKLKKTDPPNPELKATDKSAP